MNFSILYRHEKIALHFSGGKDSLACLYLLKPFWDRITVYWVNSGAAFQETIKQMECIKSIVPHFVEVKSDQPGQIERNGLPVDLVNPWNTPVGRIATGGNETKVQAAFDCCYENLWFPMQKLMIDSKVTLIIRGQRKSDKRKAPISSGVVFDGVEYWFPVEDWTKEDVLAFLKDSDVQLPENYQCMDSSLDCWSCTAYMDEHAGKVEYMKAKHPELHERNRQSMKSIIESVARDFENMKNLYG